MPRINGEQIEKFFNLYLSFPDSCVEVMAPFAAGGGGRRIVRSAKDVAYGGWFLDPYELAVEMERLDGVSAYWSTNPVKIGRRPGEGRNTLRCLRKGEGVQDIDIQCIRFMCIDIDHKRTLVPAASTDPEMAERLSIRDGIVADRSLADHCMVGMSGNGGFILVRLPDLPNDETTRAAVAAYIDGLRDYKGQLGGHVDIQKSVSSPCRMVAVPGTRKCKGDFPTPGRPWRIATIDVKDSVIPFDLMGWADRYGVRRRPSKAKADPHVPRRKRKDAYSQARAWLFGGNVGAAEGGNGGHNQTFYVACQLVKGFDLSPTDALFLLREWNAACSPPWEDGDLLHKAEEADREADSRPRGYMLRAECPTDGLEFSAGRDDPRPDGTPPGDVPPPPPFHPGAGGKDGGRIDDPVHLASLFLEDHAVSPGCCRYRWHSGQWWEWDGSCYRPVAKEDFESTLLLYIDSKIEEYNREERRIASPGQEVKPKRLSNPLREQCKVALRAMAAIRTTELSESFWVGDPLVPGWKPSEIVPFMDRNLHVPSFASGRRKSWIAKTPRLFNTYSLPYRFPFDAYDGPIDPPPQFRDYILAALREDAEAIQCYREMLGYLLTPSNKFQKMFMLIGPPRSGKGTTLRIIEHMLGVNNLCFPTFSSLAAVPFGKQQLLGKMVAIMADARLSGRTDVQSVVETILSITGNDPQTVHRKYAGEVHQRLLARFIISSNALPRLSDQSLALANRAIVFLFDNSFLGREDIDLESKLVPEIPLIFRWAIDGWITLNERGHFIQPASSKRTVDELLKLTSTIHHFKEDMLVEGDGLSIRADSAYRQYKDWCKDQGKDYPADRIGFERDLISTIRGLRMENGYIYGCGFKPYDGDVSRIMDPNIAATSNGRSEMNGHAFRDDEWGM